MRRHCKTRPMFVPPRRSLGHRNADWPRMSTVLLGMSQRKKSDMLGMRGNALLTSPWEWGLPSEVLGGGARLSTLQPKLPTCLLCGWLVSISSTQLRNQCLYEGGHT